MSKVFCCDCNYCLPSHHKGIERWRFAKCGIKPSPLDSSYVHPTTLGGLYCSIGNEHGDCKQFQPMCGVEIKTEEPPKKSFWTKIKEAFDI